MTDNAAEIIGFDIGHGESALARVIVESTAEPELLELHGERSQVTAIAMHPSLGVLIGKQALCMPDAKSVDIGFKSRPGDNLQLAATLQAFAATYHRLLRERGQLSADVSRAWLIGCPSGWSITDREHYERILLAADLPGAQVVAESRAAFMQARDSGRLTTAQLGGSVLVIDIGSSTTDFTLVANMRERAIVDVGETSLGAGLIDLAILARTLATHPRRGEIESAFALHPPHKSHCLLACRRAKEEYFRHEPLYADDRTNSATSAYEIDESLLFKPRVNASAMRDVLSARIPALANAGDSAAADSESPTWPAAFRLALLRARDQMAASGQPPKTILMTGGASRMSFTQSIVAEVFTGATLLLDAEPEFCIARGLARVGRWDRRVTGFRRDIDTLCAADGKLVSAVRAARDLLLTLLADALSLELVNHSLRPRLNEWRGGQVETLADLERLSAASAEAWLTNTRSGESLMPHLSPWIDRVLAQVIRDVDAISARYHIPAGALALRDLAPELRHVLDDAAMLCRDAVGIEFLTTLIGFATGAIIALLIGGMAHLSLTHPVGWIVLLTGVIGVSAIGTDRAKERLRGASLPGWVRRAILTERGIDRRCTAARGQVRAKLQEKLVATPKLLETFEARLTGRMRELLHERAEAVAILI